MRHHKQHKQHTRRQLPAAGVANRLALFITPAALLASAALAAPTPQVVTAEVVSVAGPGSGMLGFYSIHSDEEGSWVASGVTLGQNDEVLYGDLAGSGSTTPSVLRRPQVLNGYTQLNLFLPRVLRTRIAYAASAPSPAVGFSSWIDDFLVAAPGVAIGTTGLEWTASGTPRLTTGTRIFVKGTAQPLGGQGPPTRVVVRYPEEVLELSSGDIPIGLNGQVTSIRTFESSPDGNWWTAVVDYESIVTGQIEQAVLRNGQVHTVGAFNIERATTEHGTWESFAAAFVGNSSAVTFQGRDQFGDVIYRSGRLAFRGPRGPLVDVDKDGLALTRDYSGQSLQHRLDGLPLDRPGAGGVDADGDGFADAGWAITQVPSLFGATFLGDGRVLEVASVQVPGNGVQDAIVLASLALPADVVCDGVPNSTREPSTLRAVGTDRVGFNDLQLRVANLPQGAFVLPLVSSTTDFVPNAGGSFGNLCLGGSIGRGAILSGGENASATFRAYPSSLPQPNGTVAAQAGQTWYFQVWHRDAVMGTSGSNFSAALGVTFR